jgi:hypothetical protein
MAAMGLPASTYCSTNVASNAASPRKACRAFLSFVNKSNRAGMHGQRLRLPSADRDADSETLLEERGSRFPWSQLTPPDTSFASARTRLNQSRPRIEVGHHDSRAAGARFDRCAPQHRPHCRFGYKKPTPRRHDAHARARMRARWQREAGS